MPTHFPFQTTIHSNQFEGHSMHHSQCKLQPCWITTKKQCMQVAVHSWLASSSWLGLVCWSLWLGAQQFPWWWHGLLTLGSWCCWWGGGLGDRRWWSSCSAGVLQRRLCWALAGNPWLHLWLWCGWWGLWCLPQHFCWWWLLWLARLSSWLGSLWSGWWLERCSRPGWWLERSLCSS